MHFAVRTVVFENVAVSVKDFYNGCRFDVNAFIGKGAVCTGHFKRCNAFRQAAEGGRGQIIVIRAAVFNKRCNAQFFGIGNDVGRTDFIGKLNGDRVNGERQRFPERHTAPERVIRVVRRPTAVGYLLIFHCRVGRHVVFQCCHVDERLEGRTGLTDGHAGAVETVLAATADHGKDVTVFRVNRNDSSLRLCQTLIVFMCFRQVIHGCDGGMLFVRIKGCINFQAFFIQRVVTVFLSDFLGYVVDKVCRFIRRIARRLLFDIQLRPLRFCRLLRSNIPVFFHLTDDDIFAGRRFTDTGRIIIRALRQARDHGAFGKG